MYIHERKGWPDFTWDRRSLADRLAEVRYLQGRLLGGMEALGFPLAEEATLRVLTEDAVKTSEIEGEKLPYEAVRSSIARRLGIESGGIGPRDRNADGIAEVLLDATRRYDAPLTKERLCGWQAALFPTGRSGLSRIKTGAWRGAESGAMQVVSGAYGKEKVHFEAPEHRRLESEMRLFLRWANAPSGEEPVIKAALSHFWFVTLHPFEDGNGRIARAISDMMLARSEGSPRRFYSLSSQIQKERTAYYDILERCQKGPLDVTPWIDWFLGCLKRALTASRETLESILKKDDFWKAHAGASLNERQRAVINRLLDGFEGKLTTSKWAQLTKCSQDTALRDIDALLERGILVKESAGGRSTHYRLAPVASL